MSRWKSVLTNSGANLLASATGNMLRITRAKCGSGYVSEDDLINQINVSAIKKDMEIVQLSSKNNVSSLRLQLKNEGIMQPFELRQIGVYGKLNNDTEDVLYMLLQIEEESEPDVILAEQQSPNYVYECLINLIVGNAQELTANVNTAAFVSIEQHQLELNKKVSKESGKLLSSNDYTNEDKQKLENAVPKTRKINNKALSGDISLTASDVGAVANTASGGGSLALGDSSKAAGTYSISLGYNTNAVGNFSAALGSGTEANGLISTAIGFNARAVGNSSLALGEGARAAGDSSVALGTGAAVLSSENNTIRLGDNDDLSALKCRVNLTTTSDERDKTDIKNIANSLEFLKQINPIQYVSNHRASYLPETPTAEQQELINKYGLAGFYDKQKHKQGTKKGERKRVGVSAQEVRQALINTYGTDNYANIVDDDFYDLNDIDPRAENQLTVAYSNFIPFLIDAVKDLSSQVEELKAELNKKE